MKKFIARFLAPVVLAAGIVGITAGTANANPPRRNQCYSTYQDGTLTRSTYTFLRQTVYTCVYSKYSYSLLLGQGWYSTVTVDKVSIYV